jgi:hypothetical protein
MKAIGCIFFAVFILESGIGMAPLWALSPSGSEFRVNTTLTNDQVSPVVAIDSNGAFVVVWSGNGPGDTNGIFAQRYNAAGTALGSEFLVNISTTGDQGSPAVAMNAAGDFVIAWSGKGSGDPNGIYARRYDAAGVAQGGEFQVNTTDNGNQDVPSVGMDTAGNFIIVWSGKGADDANGIYAQRYNAAGTAQGGEFQVNTSTTGNQDAPSIGMNGTGNFVIAWSGNGTEGTGPGVYAQRYNAAGVAQGGEFLVSTFAAGNQRFASTAMNSAGDFAIAWESTAQDGIYGQRYNAAGTAQGGEFHVNTFITGDQTNASVAMDSGGHFVVAWESSAQDGGGAGIYAQSFDAASTAQGIEFRINTQTAGDQTAPFIAVNASGNGVAVWQSAGQDGSGEGIYAQRFESSVTVAAPSTPDLTVDSDTGASDTDNQTTDTTPTFTGTAPDGTTVNLYEGTTLLGSAAVSGGVYTITSSALTPGSHTVHAQAVDGGSNTSPFSGTLTVTIYASRHELWKQENFGPDAGNPAIAGDTADPDNDGVVNLLEYAWDADPNIWDLGTSPLLSLDSSSGRLRIEFRRVLDRTDLIYRVQVSDDLAAWTAIAEANGGDPSTTVLGGLSVIVSETGTPIKVVVTQDNTAPAGPMKRFLRVAVEKL